MYIGIHVKYTLFLTDFNETSILSTDFRKNIQIPNFMKIRPVVAEFFFMRTDGQTDRQDIMKLIVAFRNFENAPNKSGKSEELSTVLACFPVSCFVRY
jgi:hypothetical protein